LFAASLKPDTDFISALERGRVLAFAGIGNPDKFFATLAAAGITLGETRSFPDHHFYTRAEAQDLCARADAEGFVLVTTEKDMARLAGDSEVAELAAQAHALPVELVFEDEGALSEMLIARLGRVRKELTSRI
jgi:tetraacyldisaccharide 4'-kinase